MTTLTEEKTTANQTSGVTPSANLAGEGNAARMVRKLASSPASFYNWLAGPALSDQKRERIALAEVTNSLGRRTFLL